MVDYIQQFKDRHLFHQCTNEEELNNQLNKEKSSFYIGFDATSDALHAGSLVQLRAIKQLVKLGHQAIILLGGGTTKVGDPSGKDESRKILEYETIDNNIENFKRIFNHYFRDYKDNITYVNNDTWLSDLNYIELLRTVGSHLSINRMLTFESVKERLKREQSLSFLEFNYMVLQSYDFYYLNKNHNCSLQIGGSDQWGNIVLGIELISKISKKDSYGLTTPLLTTSSGKKMGKTEQGAVWIDKEKFNSFDFFQYWRNVDDKDVEKLLLIFSDLDKEEITSLIQEDINKAKKKLALVVTSDCHTKEDALAAEQKATDLFENKNFDQDVDLIQINNDVSLKLTDILAINNLIPSKSEAKRMIENNGIKINDIAINDINHEITDKDEGSILKIGKKRIFKISFKN
ncbi:tyrosine--tRNA ligase [Alphaproteobacteria bacterium]|nr:tyrosine--tRNA ligase [Alphaproteobacteria bacterium]MDB4233971.1 tyrosine--tRNA ligase [Alphaproteobacteria bacterium]